MIHSNRQAIQQLKIILAHGVDLTLWEWDFVDSLTTKDLFSLKQREVIDRIYSNKVPRQFQHTL